MKSPVAIAAASLETWRPSPAEPVASCLIVLEGRTNARYVLPATGSVVLGRAPECDIVLVDGAASRQHTAVRVNGGVVTVEDLGSRNGTRVNDRLIAETTALLNGDLLTVGAASVVVMLRNAEHRTVLSANHFRQRLAEELERGRRYGRSVSIALLRLRADRTQLNGLLGSIRPIDSLAPWQGDSVVVLFPELEPEAALTAVGLLLDAALRIDPQALAGVASAPFDANDADALLAAVAAGADQASAGDIRTAAETGQELQLGERSVLVAEPSMRRAFQLLARLGPSALPVLVLGETGSGKENAAWAVHHASSRAAGPFVALNCAAVPDSLLESELFGYEKGAFTGATSSKKGFFERASSGTLFLDEVGDLSLAAQAKLLRAVETSRVTPVGSTQERAVDVRLVAATHRDLDGEVAAGRFRQDLFFRLNGATVILAPLRQRPREIPLLAKRFLESACGRLPREPMTLAPSALQALLDYSWPGNVRELKNAMDFAAATESGRFVESWHLPERLRVDGVIPSGAERAAEFRPLADEVFELEVKRMREALTRTHGVQTEAADLLGMPRRTFVYKLRAYAQRGIRFDLLR